MTDPSGAGARPAHARPLRAASTTASPRHSSWSPWRSPPTLARRRQLARGRGLRDGDRSRSWVPWSGWSVAGHSCLPMHAAGRRRCRGSWRCWPSQRRATWCRSASTATGSSPRSSGGLAFGRMSRQPRGRRDGADRIGRSLARHRRVDVVRSRWRVPAAAPPAGVGGLRGAQPDAHPDAAGRPGTARHRFPLAGPSRSSAGWGRGGLRRSCSWSSASMDWPRQASTQDRMPRRWRGRCCCRWACMGFGWSVGPTFRAVRGRGCLPMPRSERTRTSCRRGGARGSIRGWPGGRRPGRPDMTTGARATQGRGIARFVPILGWLPGLRQVLVARRHHRGHRGHRDDRAQEPGICGDRGHPCRERPVRRRGRRDHLRSVLYLAPHLDRSQLVTGGCGWWGGAAHRSRRRSGGSAGGRHRAGDGCAVPGRRRAPAGLDRQVPVQGGRDRVPGGAAIDVVIGELPKLTGTSADGSNAWQELASWLRGLGDIQWATLLVGGVALAVILGLRFCGAARAGSAGARHRRAGRVGGPGPGRARGRACRCRAAGSATAADPVVRTGRSEPVADPGLGDGAAAHRILADGG